MLHKYIFMLSALLMSSTALQTVAQEQDNVLNNLSPFAIKMMKQVMPSSLQEAAAAQMREAVSADDIELRVDSTVYYSADVPEDKDIYTYDDQEGSVTLTEQYWDADNSCFVSFNYLTTGPAVDDQPAYHIYGSFDEDGQQVPRSRVVYDLTPHVELNEDIFPTEYNHPSSRYSWEDGVWKLTNRISAQYNESLITSLANYEADDDDAVSMCDSITISYNEANLPICQTLYDESGEKIGSFIAQYDDQARLLKYGCDNDSWYLQYEYDQDTTICSEYKVANEVPVIQYRKIVSVETLDETIITCQIEEFYTDGVLSGNRLYNIVSMSDNGFSVTSYSCGENGEKLNLESFSVETIDDEQTFSYLVYDEEEGTFESESYHITTEQIDEYTTCEVFYNELDLESYRCYTYYHNPNTTSIGRISNASSNDGPVYDLKGSKSLDKNGLLIKNGKVVFVK